MSNSKRRSRKALRLKRALTHDAKVPPGLWRCPDCSGLFSKQKGGDTRHMRSCKARAATQNSPNLPDSPTLDAQASQSAASECSLDDLSDYNDTFKDIEAPPTQTRQRGANNVSNYGASTSRLLPEPETQAGSPAGSITEEVMLDSADLEDRSGIPALADGQVWVRRHPASGQASSLRSLSDHIGESSSPPSTTILSTWPFQTLADLTQTEVFVKHHASNSHMNDQLVLEQGKLQDPANPLTLRSAADVHAVLELAVPSDTQFLVFDFDTDFCGQKYTHRLRMRSLRAIFSRMLVDPELQDHLVFFPEQIYVRNPEDGTPMRLWEESWHGNDWWNLQSKLGFHTRILYIHVYTDATKVSTFGGLKVWPLYAWIGNVPSALRRKRKTGGAVLIGFIPVVHKDKKLSDSQMAELRVMIYHQAMALMLKKIKILMGHGDYFQCADGKVYFFVAVIGVISADYEEMAKIAAILGSLSGFPCPICLVPREDQGDLSGTEWPLRTHKDTLDVLDCARKAKTVAARKLICREQSLRATASSLIPLMGENFSLFQAFVADPLHQIELGVFGKHMWPWILNNVLKDLQQAELDERFKSVPSYPDLKHFPNGVTDIENLQGKEQAIILRMLPPLIEDLLTTPHAKIITQALRALGCIHLLSKLTSHSESTLDLLSSQIVHFGALSQKLHDLFEDSFSNSYPKMHSLAHLVDIIKRKSTTDNYHTGLGEGVHPELKAAYKKTNKQPGFEQQQSMMSIRERLKRAETASAHPPDQPSAIDSTNESQNFDLGSKCRRLLTSDFIARQSNLHPNHKHFERDLKTFLYQNVAGLGHRRDFRLQDLPSLEGTKVTPYQLARISYVSLEDACEKVDLVRANLEWRGSGAR
ncbi:hypothetical protein FRC07_005011, partial [Ceratobasidium sp. 392]